MSSALHILNGRRFSCTQCGHCCLKDGLVYLHTEELTQMAAHLKMTQEVFRTTFRVEYDPASEQPVLLAKEGKGCPLLDDKLRCRVHAVKPSQCRTFPFWSELLDDEDAWNEARQDCPGMDSPTGRLYSPEEIRKIRDQGLSTT
ncbi:MAG: YkgJ family cysteine cluster protein [Myxococcota bacterium]|nr:YkgJ family cysteine cluster protein [Myxococcota bacterium]